MKSKQKYIYFELFYRSSKLWVCLEMLNPKKVGWKVWKWIFFNLQKPRLQIEVSQGHQSSLISLALFLIQPETACLFKYAILSSVYSLFELIILIIIYWYVSKVFLNVNAMNIVSKSWHIRFDCCTNLFIIFYFGLQHFGIKFHWPLFCYIFIKNVLYM